MLPCLAARSSVISPLVLSKRPCIVLMPRCVTSKCEKLCGVSIVNVSGAALAAPTNIALSATAMNVHFIQCLLVDACCVPLAHRVCVRVSKAANDNAVRVLAHPADR